MAMDVSNTQPIDGLTLPFRCVRVCVCVCKNPLCGLTQSHTLQKGKYCNVVLSVSYDCHVINDDIKRRAD